MRRTAAGARTLAGIVLVASAAPSPTRAQETLELDGAIRTALVRSPGVTTAEANAATAAADRWAHWGALLPSASVSAGIGSFSSTTLTFVDPDGSRVVLDDPVVSDRRSNSAGLNLNLQLGAETFTTIDAGGEQREAAEHRVSAAQALVVRQVKVAYFEALKQQRLLELAQRQLELRREEFDLTEDKYEIAAADRSELLAAEIAVRSAELALLEAQDAVDRAVRAIRVAQGVDELADTDVILLEPPAVPGADALAVDDLLLAARGANPQLRALAAEERAASTNVWAARSSYLPTLSANLNFGRSRELAARESFFEFSPANTSSSFQLSLNLPLFNGFQRKQRSAAASNQLTVARASLREQEIAIEQQLRGLVEDLRRGDRRLEVLEGNVELAEERLELTREQYRLGTVQYINLQQAIQDLDSAAGDVYEQRYELLKRWAELEELVGGRALDD